MAARCLMRLGRAPEADAFFRNAAPLPRGDAHERAYNLVNLNQPDEAVDAYEDLLMRWPDDVLALKRLAALRMGLKQWRETLKVADRLAAIPDGNVAALTMTAIAQHELKHYDQAAAAALRVLDIDPGLAQMPLPRSLFWNNLAVDLIAGGRAAEARSYLGRAWRSRTIRC